ncbi:hypothetical protein [Streptomyces sp. SID8499]|uniref:hypothetical protein n=1 Tax=Streptomyces sp. SID8499 TaxID=2706106 RepID=UPI0013C829B3|nr:hypothetical protein [Streptomyces sp. SID8499]NED31812.1 hypothetical protein [Streptomyces sp. SID8499]
MLVPTGHLSSLQQQLLRELDLCDLPAPEAAPESYAARDLDLDQVRDILPELLWAGLVEQRDSDRGTLGLTVAGAAALRSAECDELTARLAAVVSFADTVARGAPPRAAGHALKRLADGAWSLERAEAHVRDADGS